MVVAQSSLYLLAFAGSIVALLFALLSTLKVLRQDSGNEAMRKISAAIREGAAAYLNRQYKTSGKLLQFPPGISYSRRIWKKLKIRHKPIKFFL